MNAYQNLEDSLFTVVNTLYPSWELVMAYDNGPEPLLSYCVIDVQRVDPIGREYSVTPTIGEDGIPLVGTTIQDHQAKVKFEFIGRYEANTTTAQMATDLQVALRTTRGYELLAMNNLSLFGITTLRRLPLKREADMYMLYQLECMFGYSVVMTEDIDYVLALGIDGVYHDAGQKPTHTINSRIEFLQP